MSSHPSSSKEDLRLFLAIAISQFVCAKSEKLQQKLRPLLPSHGVRWARLEQFHLTLKFLGNVPANDVPALKKTVQHACATLPQLPLRAQGLGFFPNNFSPRVFWAGVESESKLLIEFQRQLAAAVDRFTEKQDDQKFTAHITLARFEKLPPYAANQLYKNINAGEFFGAWTAQEVELIESTLSPNASLYAILEKFPLRNR